MAAADSSFTSKILKALGVFGGVQALSIVCSVIRTKLAALWIGPVGVGIITLYNSTMELINSTVQLNLRQSSVRELSQAGTLARQKELSAVVRRISLVQGVAGMLLTLLLAPLLSQWTFGDSQHIWAFRILSVVVLFSALGNGENAIMQGFDNLGNLAKAGVSATVAGVAVTLPLIYFFRLKAIVALVFTYLFAQFVFSFFYRVQGLGSAFAISWRVVWAKSKGMLALGAYMTVSSFVGILVSYLFAIYLNRYYNTDTIGLYQSGFTLVNTYVGIVFTAIAYEFYPRLSSMINNPFRVSVIVSHEAKVALALLLPLVLGFVCCAPLIVHILYSSEFEAVVPFISVAVLGVPLRAVSWCFAYTILAKGDGRYYILSEVVSALVNIVLNILFFKHWGWAGIGVAYIIWYAVYTLIVCLIYRLHFGFRVHSAVWITLAITMATGALALFLSSAIGRWWTLALLVIPVVAVSYALIFKRKQITSLRLLRRHR